MKKKYIKYFILMVICLLCFIPNKTYASSTYTITDYDINMEVNENNTFDITETITVYFNTSSHGIYREIPLKNTITRTDGTTSKNTAKVSNIEVSETYSTSKTSSYYSIKIGSSSQKITGSHTYVISYTYDIGKDPLDDADELYFNLIGDEWDTSIDSVTFTITMPKEFDSSSLGFSSGTTGTTDSSNVEYTVDGNVISGSTISTLNSGEALTVRLTLPEDYFVGENLILNTYAIIVISICIIFVLIAFLIWKKYGKDDEVIEIVQFYPPEGYNSAEIAYMYHGESTTEGSISLLIYLADKGYLKIEERETEKIISSGKGFKITKLKEYDGNNEEEKLFFNGLFKNQSKYDYGLAARIIKEAKAVGEKISYAEALEKSVKDEKDGGTQVTEDDLYNSFYTTLSKVKNNITKKFKSKVFENLTSKNNIILTIMITIILWLVIFKVTFNYLAGDLSSIESTIYTVILVATYMLLLEPLIIAIIKVRDKATKWIIFAIIIIIMACFAPVYSEFMFELDTIEIAMFIIGIISIIILGIFMIIMPKRTKFGNEMLGKIRGFKRFLEMSEKEQLELLVRENPEYFYNILPYTYALGVSDTWMKQFETISIKEPDWYKSAGDFNTRKFNRSMTNIMTSANRSMSSSPSSGSSSGSFGGSSGGSHSGGGSGGGGGHSW